MLVCVIVLEFVQGIVSLFSSGVGAVFVQEPVCVCVCACMRAWCVSEHVSVCECWCVSMHARRLCDLLCACMLVDAVVCLHVFVCVRVCACLCLCVPGCVSAHTITFV